MSKKDIFLGQENRCKIYKRLAAPQPTIDIVMRAWPVLDNVDNYESIAYDEIAEMQHINDEFVRYYNQFARKKITTLHTVDDYLNYDMEQPSSTTVSSSVYRDNNRIPYRQKLPPRNYDHEETGLRGRSLEAAPMMAAGMAKLWEAVNQPYRKIDDFMATYYGQEQD